MIEQQRNQSQMSQIVQNPLTQVSQVSIDKTWISSIQKRQVDLKQHLLTCPICYNIPIDYPVQCKSCERIFCKKDYDTVIRSDKKQDNKCPTCKATPWHIKDQTHISYRQILDAMKLKCKLCEQIAQKDHESITPEEEMTREQLIKHLQEKHNKVLSVDSILMDYTMVSKDGKKEHILSQIQNIEVNIKKGMGYKKFQVLAEKNLLNVDLDKMIVSTSQGEYILKSQRSVTIQKNKKYRLWVYHNEAQSQGLFQYKRKSLNGYFSQHKENKYVFYPLYIQTLISGWYKEFKEKRSRNVQIYHNEKYTHLFDFSRLYEKNTTTQQIRMMNRVKIIFR